MKSEVELNELKSAVMSLAKLVVLHQMEANAFRASFRRDFDIGQYEDNLFFQRNRLQPLLDAIGGDSLQDLIQAIEKTLPTS